MSGKSYLERIRILGERGQNPHLMVISCSDSRVPPELILKTGPGKVFTYRHIAALVPPFKAAAAAADPLAAALEFALISFDITDIAVLGHTQCGGISALTEHLMHPENRVSTPITLNWVLQAREAFNAAIRRAPENLAAAVEIQSLLWSLENLEEYPVVADRVDVKLHAWQFDLAKGKLLDHTP